MIEHLPFLIVSLFKLYIALGILAVEEKRMKCPLIIIRYINVFCGVCAFLHLPDFQTEASTVGCSQIPVEFLANSC